MPADFLSSADIERARAIAAAAADVDPRGFSGVGARCGISRTRASMFARNHYQVNGKQVSETKTAIKVLAALDGWTCPYTQAHITPDACRTVALAPVPTHHPARLAHWKACQHCPGRPATKKED